MTPRYIILILFLFIGSYSRAQESMMQDVSYPFLEKLIAAARSNYPKVKAYEAQARMAKLNVDKQKLDWFNILTFAYLYSPNNSITVVNPSLLNGYQFGVTTSLGNILQKPDQVKIARVEYDLAKLSQEEYNLGIEAIVKQRYFMYIEQLSILNWKIKDLESSESTLKDIKYKFEKGEDIFENYNKALAYHSTIVQSKIQAEGALLMAKASLEEIIGAKLETIN
jgi:outer membrane protein TolC